nr:VIT domain-containing protein [Calditrichia bacterium]
MKTTSLFRLALWITGLFFYAGSALGQGRIIFPPFPEPHFHPQPVSLSSVDARVDIRDGVAEVQLGQEFYNPNNRELEGDYLFAIPGEAQIRDFSLYINGRKQQGQILDAREAQKIYEDIVRRLVDPALLQYAGQGLFKTRIFPFPARGNREVEIRYATVLGYENNLYRLVLPVRQSGQASIDRYNLTINLSSRDALGNIYSPTHALSVQRNGDREATITLSQNGFAGDKDIVLYYSLRDQGDIPANLLTFRPRTDEDGFFMWMATPAEVRQAARIPRDLTFVVDVSGSMQGEKMVQAREALKFAVGTLKREDRFQILAFSSTVRAFQRGLLPATRENLENARYFIDELRPGGGTNIEEALLNALDAKKARDNRMTAIVFLTDGLPTVGETDIARLLEKIKREGNEFTRLFNFGVGYDVNTFLLDKLAEESRGSSNYVRPEENIEEAVSNFVSKIGDPILTDPDLAFGNLPVYDVFPARLPDLFAGQRVLVMGRYRPPADGNFELTGRQGGR